MPILLTIRTEGDRFTPLQQRLGIAPARLSENLKRLQELGMVVHLNPYERRHPLLPEYVLTEKGMLFREIAKAIQATEDKMHLKDILTKQWNLPVLFSLSTQAQRFSDIRTEVPLITPKMLAMRLDELQDWQLVDKAIITIPSLRQLYLLTQFSQKPISTLAQDILSIVS